MLNVIKKLIKTKKVIKTNSFWSKAQKAKKKDEKLLL